MREYRWKGIDRSGRHQQGYLQATSTTMLREELFKQGIALLDHHHKKRLRTSSIQFFQRTKFTPHELKEFFAHLSTMLSSGIDLVTTLNTFADQQVNTHLKQKIQHVSTSVTEGNSLAQSLGQLIPEMNPSLLSLIQTGEKTGTLATLCKKISHHINEAEKLKTSIKQALMLPVLTLGFALFITLGILIFIIPQFQEIFATSHVPLPTSTKTLLALSTLLRSINGILMLASLPLLCILFALTKQGKKYIRRATQFLSSHIIFLRQPLYLATSLSFLETLQIFLTAGQPLSAGVIQAQKSIPNQHLAKNLKPLSHELARGKSLEISLGLLCPHLFEKSVRSLIGIGERTGKLEAMLEKACTVIKEKLDQRLLIIKTLITPLIMILLGVFIALMLVTIYVPIFNLAKMPHL